MAYSAPFQINSINCLAVVRRVISKVGWPFCGQNDFEYFVNFGRILFVSIKAEFLYYGLSVWTSSALFSAKTWKGRHWPPKWQKMPVHLELSDQRPNEWVLWCLHHHNLKTSFPTQQIPAFQLWVVWKGLSFENEWLIQWEHRLQILCLVVLFCLKPILVSVIAPKEFLWLKSFIFLLNWECFLSKLRMLPLWMPDVRRRVL